MNDATNKPTLNEWMACTPINPDNLPQDAITFTDVYVFDPNTPYPALTPPAKYMRPYIVLYRQEASMAPSDPPFGFACWADDADHADEQCMNCYPDADTVWVHRGVGVDTRFDYQDALNDYFTKGMSNG